MKPRIGITVDVTASRDDARTGGGLNLNWNYASAIADSGGVPILIPPMADMAEIAPILHGLVIPGGADIDASRFGEENHPEVELQNPERYDGEARLMAVLPAEVPVFGICYGCQFINVLRGGSLIQHLPDVTETPHTGGVLQEYVVSGADLVPNGRIEGKSYHHQAIKDLGHGLRVVARAIDGTIEAVEATDRPWLLGVQWHPERTFDDPLTRTLFGRFVDAAGQYASSRTPALAL